MRTLVTKAACPISWSMDAMLSDVVAVVVASRSRLLTIPLTIFSTGKKIHEFYNV